MHAHCYAGAGGIFGELKSSIAPKKSHLMGSPGGLMNERPVELYREMRGHLDDPRKLSERGGREGLGADLGLPLNEGLGPVPKENRSSPLIHHPDGGLSRESIGETEREHQEPIAVGIHRRRW